MATVNPARLQKLKNNAKKQKISLFEIGFVASGKGIQYWQGNKTLRIENLGWMHFRS